MNTRLQVEHPVTEMITGVDLVEWQLRVAQGEPLPRGQDELGIQGHALEARIYAEDPERDFLPSIGRISQWRMPEESARVRIDTGFRAGDEVSPYYDPMLAKLIVHGDDRQAACALMHAALAQCAVAGVATNLGLLERLVVHPAFASGQVDTGLIARHAGQLLHASPVTEEALIAAALAEYLTLAGNGAQRLAAGGDPYSPWGAVDGWWLGSHSHRISYAFAGSANLGAGAKTPGQAQTIALAPLPGGRIRIDVMGRSLSARVVRGTEEGSLVIDDGSTLRRVTVVAAGATRQVIAGGERVKLTLVDPYAAADDAEDDRGHLHAPMSGTIVAVAVGPGDPVKKGAPLVVLEAMKMEHTIVAPADGVVTAVHCAVGERVAEGVDLVAFTKAT